jgi:thioredoxin reductase (NADPH)
MSESPFDLAVVGGGATGLAAAIQGASDGLRVVLLERGTPGGRIRERLRIEVVPGLPVGPTGEDFVEEAVSTAIRLGAEIRSAREVAALEPAKVVNRLRLTDGSVVGARSVIIATGTEYPDPGVPGIREFTGRGVHFGVPGTLPAILRGDEAFVTGDPAEAATAALLLADHCRRVTIVSFGAPALARVGEETGARLRARPQIDRKLHLEIAEAVGVERLEALVLRDGRSGRMRVRKAAALFVLGVDRPRTGWLVGTLALDARGYVLTGGAVPARAATHTRCLDPFPPAGLESSRSAVFAAGGARGTRGCCVASAGGEGVRAAREALHHLRARERARGAGS